MNGIQLKPVRILLGFLSLVSSQSVRLRNELSNTNILVLT